MKGGNWVPIDKRAIKFIPDDRPFSELEALFSLQVAYDCNQRVSLSRFSKLWKWSKGRVKRFLEKVGLKIEYPGQKHAPKNGTLMVQLQNTDRTLSFLCNKGSKTTTKQLQNTNGTLTDTGIKTKTNTKTKRIKTFLSDSTEYRLAELLFNKICARNPNHKKPNLQTWAKHIDYAIRIDKRDKDVLEKIIVWCQKDGFWQNNILSTEKIREKFDKLFLKMNSNGGNKKEPEQKELSFEEEQNHRKELEKIRSMQRADQF